MWKCEKTLLEKFVISGRGNFFPCPQAASGLQQSPLPLACLMWLLWACAGATSNSGELLTRRSPSVYDTHHSL